ncbi:MAG: penicillin-binding transpeptidase domain-containing protein, partial [Rikenellaceae bacterium]
MSRDIKASKESIVKSDILIRVRVLHLLFVAIGLVILVRLLWVQLGSAEVRFNAERLKGRIFSEHEVLARRGSILSREGEPLATSIFCYQVQMDFGCEGFDSLKTYYEQSDSLSKLLSAYFGDRSAAEYRKFFRQQRAKNYQLAYLRDSSIIRSEGWFNRLVDRFRGELYVDIPIYDTLRIHTPVALFPRGVDYTEWLELKRYPILNWNMGMTYSLSESDERVYPQGELARRTIGKLMGERGSDYGIEKLCSLELSGQDGLVMRQRIARGFYGRVAGGEQQERVDGYDVVTTIDLDLQDVSDKALRRALERHDALWGTCIVMEVATGDILAMANLNRQSDGSYREEENHAIGARMEPGSTFKLAATIALLEDAKLSTSTTYDSGDGKYIKVGSTRVRDSHSGFKEVDMRTAFSNSLNGYFAQAVYEAYKDNPQQYTDFLRTLQIDSTKGFEVLGERKPRFPTPGSDIWWRHMTLVYMGYGYGVELSPLQTMSLYNAVANDGKMVAPRLLREIRRGDEVLREIQ